MRLMVDNSRDLFIEAAMLVMRDNKLVQLYPYWLNGRYYVRSDMGSEFFLRVRREKYAGVTEIAVSLDGKNLIADDHPPANVDGSRMPLLYDDEAEIHTLRGNFHENSYTWGGSLTIVVVRQEILQSSKEQWVRSSSINVRYEPAKLLRELGINVLDENLEQREMISDFPEEDIPWLLLPEAVK